MIQQGPDVCYVNTQNGGISGTIHTLKQYLQEFTTRYQHQMASPYFQHFDLLDVNGLLLDVMLSNTTFFDQVVFEMHDDRLGSNDNRKYQCLSFIGENHNSSSQDIPEDIASIKVWTLCKLLKKKYNTAVAVYVELQSDLKHDEVYNFLNLLSCDVYKNHEGLLDTLNQIEENTKTFFDHKYLNRKYSFIAIKKPDKYPVLRLNADAGSQSILNTTYKLLQGTNHNGVGITFVDCRKVLLKHYCPASYIDSLYSNTLNAFKTNGYAATLKLLEGLLIIFSPINIKPSQLHIRSMLDFHKIDAFNNNNRIFFTTFEYADFTRDFYNEILLYLYQYISYMATNNVDIRVALKNVLIFNDTIRIKYFSLCQSINYNPHLNSHVNPNLHSNLNANLNPTLNPNLDPNAYHAFGVVNDNFDAKGKTIFLMEGLGIDNIPFQRILRVIISKIMDYYTMVQIYNNIFFLKNGSYSPDYHIIIEGWTHSAFTYHCFLYSINQNHQVFQKGPFVSTYSTQNSSPHEICDITRMYYPKVPSIYNS